MQPHTVANFYGAVMAALGELGVAVRIHTTPNAMPDAIPCEQEDYCPLRLSRVEAIAQSQNHRHGRSLGPR